MACVKDLQILNFNVNANDKLLLPVTLYIPVRTIQQWQHYFLVSKFACDVAH